MGVKINGPEENFLQKIYSVDHSVCYLLRYDVPRNRKSMTNQEYFSLFSESMNKKKIIRYENSSNRDDYHIYAIRETQEGYVFYCLVETFFRTGLNENTWKTGSLSSFHELTFVKGASTSSLYLTDETFTPRQGYKERLPLLAPSESGWKTVD